MQTLVLDQSYRPVNVVTWQRAMGYILRERADVLEEYGAVVHAGIQMPAVVRLTNHLARAKQRVKFSRGNIWLRDRYRCQYCGQRFPRLELTFDHVIPRCRGGKTGWTNIVTSCWPCNSAKSNRTPIEADMRLLREPERPSWDPVYNHHLRLKNVPPEWKDYWTIELEHDA